MIKLIRSGEVFAPQRLGVKDILIIGDKIACIEDAIPVPTSPHLPVEVVEAGGRLVFPGFVDVHVHLTGGGGESGFRSRTPEIQLSSLVRGGITTVIGCLGTDSITRSPESLYAKTKALDEEGITAFMLTGAYRVPIPTLTGSPMKDLLLIDKVVGAGEIALSDHRSAQPQLEELKRLAADVRVGGILSGKAGVVNLHLGDGPACLDLLREVVASTEIPHSQFLPTHVGRNPRLFQAALEYAREGGWIDLTAAGEPQDPQDMPACVGLRRALAAGVPEDRITFSSDGQGSLPVFNEQQELVALGVGEVTALYREVRDAVLREGIPLPTALRTITQNPATLYKLKGKGQIAPNADADLVLVDRDGLAVRTVLAKGRILMREGCPEVVGTFESVPTEG